jgi:hypothetical protein
MPRKKLRYLCHATCNGRTIAGPHPDPNEVERLAWEYLRVKVCRYHDATERAAMKTKREVSAVGGVRLIVRGPDGFPVETVLLDGGGGFWNEAQRVKRSGFGRLCQAP